MSILEITNTTTRFVVAEMEYVGLIEQAVDFERKGPKAVSAKELEAIRAAKKKRDALEAEFFALVDRTAD